MFIFRIIRTVTLGGGALSIGLGGGIGFGFMFGWVDGETWGNVLGWSIAGWAVDRALVADLIDFEGRPILGCGV